MSTAKYWCDTCEGTGTIDQTLGGEHFSDPKVECPDCDGHGYWTSSKSSTPKDGGPAFPEAGMGQLASGEFHHGLPGMTLRDHFAGEALRLVAAVTWRDLDFRPVDGLSIMENNALCAYQQADAMLKARAAA